MGVTNLWQVLSPVRQDKPLSSLAGQTLAVDLSIWVCENQCVKQMQGVVTRPYLRNLYFRINCLLQLGINLIFAVEGDAPDLKHETMSRRQETQYPGKRKDPSKNQPKRRQGRTQFNAKLRECCEMLDYLGVPYIQCKGEAEALCGLLNAAGVVDGCITNDGDVFLYGAQTVYRNFSINSKDPHVEMYRMTDITQEIGLNREKMVALALLVGCDYVPKGVPGIGIEKASKLLASYGDLSPLQRFKSWRTLGDSECLDSNELQIKRKAAAVPEFPQKKVIDEFMIPKDPLPSRLSSWKRPKLVSLQTFCLSKLEWVEEYTQEKVLPLITLWDMKNIVKGGKQEHLKPHRIVKARIRQGIPSLEIEWYKLAGDKHCTTDYYVTVEERELFSSCFPELVKEFDETATIKKSKAKGKKKKKVTEDEKEAGAADDNNIDQLTQQLDNMGLESVTIATVVKHAKTENKPESNRKETKIPPDKTESPQEIDRLQLKYESMDQLPKFEILPNNPNISEEPENSASLVLEVNNDSLEESCDIEESYAEENLSLRSRLLRRTDVELSETFRKGKEKEKFCPTGSQNVELTETLRKSQTRVPQSKTTSVSSQKTILLHGSQSENQTTAIKTGPSASLELKQDGKVKDDIQHKKTISLADILDSDSDSDLEIDLSKNSKKTEQNNQNGRIETLPCVMKEYESKENDAVFSETTPAKRDKDSDRMRQDGDENCLKIYNVSDFSHIGRLNIDLNTPNMTRLKTLSPSLYKTLVESTPTSAAKLRKAALLKSILNSPLQAERILDIIKHNQDLSPVNESKHHGTEINLSTLSNYSLYDSSSALGNFQIESSLLRSIIASGGSTILSPLVKSAEIAQTPQSNVRDLNLTSENQCSGTPEEKCIVGKLSFDVSSPVIPFQGQKGQNDNPPSCLKPMEEISTSSSDLHGDDLSHVIDLTHDTPEPKQKLSRNISQPEAELSEHEDSDSQTFYQSSNFASPCLKNSGNSNRLDQNVNTSDHQSYNGSKGSKTCDFNQNISCDANEQDNHCSVKLKENNDILCTSHDLSVKQISLKPLNKSDTTSKKKRKTKHHKITDRSVENLSGDHHGKCSTSDLELDDCFSNDQTGDTNCNILHSSQQIEALTFTASGISPHIRSNNKDLTCTGSSLTPDKSCHNKENQIPTASAIDSTLCVSLDEKSPVSLADRLRRKLKTGSMKGVLQEFTGK